MPFSGRSYGIFLEEQLAYRDAQEGNSENRILPAFQNDALMICFRLLFLTTFLSVCGAPFLTAQSPSPYAPAPTPDRIILTWSGDPSTNQSVTWRSDGSGPPPIAEIARADATPVFRRHADTVRAGSTVVVNHGDTAVYHTAVFTGLQPNTLYAYRVGGGAHWSEWFHFRTAADGPAPFSFIYFGDAQNEIKSMWSR